MESSQKDATYIIETMIKIITQYQILSCYPGVPTKNITVFRDVLLQIQSIWLLLDQKHLHGINQLKVKNGIKKTMTILKANYMQKDIPISVKSVIKNLSPINTLELSTVVPCVQTGTNEKIASSLKSLCASTVVSLLNGIEKRKVAPEPVLTTSLNKVVLI